jgi:hypothetical protein
VVEIRVHDGHEVKKGDPIAVLSAMKMVRNAPFLPSFLVFDNMNIVTNLVTGNGHLRSPQR